MVNDQSARAGDGEGDENFQQVVLRFLLAEFKDEFVEPLREQRQHGDDRAALDDDIEEVALVDAQKMFRQQQVAGGGNTDEFGDSLDQTEDGGNNPVRHGGGLMPKCARKARKK